MPMSIIRNQHRTELHEEDRVGSGDEGESDDGKRCTLVAVISCDWGRDPPIGSGPPLAVVPYRVSSQRHPAELLRTESRTRAFRRGLDGSQWPCVLGLAGDTATAAGKLPFSTWVLACISPSRPLGRLEAANASGPSCTDPCLFTPLHLSSRRDWRSWTGGQPMTVGAAGHWRCNEMGQTPEGPKKCPVPLTVDVRILHTAL